MLAIETKFLIIFEILLTCVILNVEQRFSKIVSLQQFIAKLQLCFHCIAAKCVAKKTISCFIQLITCCVRCVYLRFRVQRQLQCHIK